jgi:hypothetical protein
MLLGFRNPQETRKDPSTRSRATRYNSAMRGIRWTGLLSVGACWFGSMSACLTATEVTVEIQTNLDCSVVRTRGLILRAGRGLDSVKGDDATSRTVHYDCTERFGEFNPIGSITLSPEALNDPGFAVSALIGLDKKSEDCQRQNVSTPNTDGSVVQRETFPGCVFTWRSTRFIKHTGLRMRMVLYVECKDIACAPNQFCGANAKCVPAELPPETCNVNTGGCTGEITSGPVADGGFSDSSAARDAKPSDSGSRIDGGVELPSTPGSIDCGGNACTNSQCCLVQNDGGVVNRCDTTGLMGCDIARCDEPGDCTNSGDACFFDTAKQAKLDCAKDSGLPRVCKRAADCPKPQICNTPASTPGWSGYVCGDP